MTCLLDLPARVSIKKNNSQQLKETNLNLNPKSLKQNKSHLQNQQTARVEEEGEVLDVAEGILQLRMERNDLQSSLTILNL